MKIQIDTELKTIIIPSSNTLDIIDILNELKNLDDYKLVTEIQKIYSEKRLLNENKYDLIPKCCQRCPNYKAGNVCHCTLPYLEQNQTFQFQNDKYPINSTSDRTNTI